MHYNVYYPNYLYHHGIKGMKWGVRKKRNAFSAKAAGHKFSAKTMSVYENMSRKRGNTTSANAFRQVKEGQLKKAEQAQAIANQRREAKQTAKANMTPEQQKVARRKKVLTAGAAVAGTAVAVYGAYKVKDYCNRYMANKEIREWSERMMTQWPTRPEWNPRLK